MKNNNLTISSEKSVIVFNKSTTTKRIKDFFRTTNMGKLVK